MQLDFMLLYKYFYIKILLKEKCYGKIFYILKGEKMISDFLIIIIIILLTKQYKKIRLPLIIIVGLSLIFVYKNNGDSFFIGFLRSFLFFIFGFVATLLDNRKDKKELSITQWFLIFFGLGISLFIIYII